jgi:hypothetical protein
VKVLKRFAKAVRRKLPVDPVKRLERKLGKAIKEERYEEAARLRDKLATLKGQPEARRAGTGKRGRGVAGRRSGVVRLAACGFADQDGPVVKGLPATCSVFALTRTHESRNPGKPTDERPWAFLFLLL